uniref:Uncharacterized protein C1orf131 homolog n=1 Tax=Culex pipiens TaxID=7175 RepID=A0A8D8JV72_CULPI
MAPDIIPIQTRASRVKEAPSEFSVTVFEPKKARANRPKLPKVKRLAPEEDAKSDDNGDSDEADIDDIFSDARRRKRKVKEDPQTFDISRARKEVINFGISGFDRDTKHEAKVALAIKLGAKAPKNPYRNYKEILEERKRQKEDTDRENRRRKGQSFGAAKSFQQHQQRARQKASDPGSVTKHYGVVDPKIGDKKKRKG